jgi:hypothetical protein
MAKKAAKSIKKTTKATKSSLGKLNKSSVEKAVKQKVEATVSHADSVKKKVSRKSSNARAAIEKLSSDGNAQAAHIWGLIKNDKNISESEIRALINSKNFFTLLGKVA